MADGDTMPDGARCPQGARSQEQLKKRSKTSRALPGQITPMTRDGTRPERSAGRHFSQHTAFVVQFAAEGDVAAGTYVGRVEHVGSGDKHNFESPDDLMAFVHEVLTRPRYGRVAADGALATASPTEVRAQRGHFGRAPSRTRTDRRER
jgi:hypothetical protein